MRTFYTKARGVTYRNDDGGKRQEIIEACFGGEPLSLVREPDNPKDANAIRLERFDGEQIGYIGAEVAAALAATMDAGGTVRAYVAQVTGGGGGKSYGVNLRILCYDPGEDVNGDVLHAWASLWVCGRWGTVLGIVSLVGALIWALIASTGTGPYVVGLVGGMVIAISVPARILARIALFIRNRTHAA